MPVGVHVIGQAVGRVKCLGEAVGGRGRVGVSVTVDHDEVVRDMWRQTVPDTQPCNSQCSAGRRINQ